MKKLFGVFCVLALTLPTFASAYGEGGYGSSSGKLSNATTNKIVRTLTRGAKACHRLEWVYRYDCYRNTYAVAANQLNGKPDYAVAREILVEVENAFNRTVTRNEDKTVPTQRRGGAQFRAIKRDARETANSEFVTALQSAETKLLRSSSNSSDHFVRIAQAVNTNKVLIRSAQLLLPFSPFATAFLAIGMFEARETTNRL